MPLEILTGPEVPALLAKAQGVLGEEAVVVSVRRIRDRGRSLFEVVVADAATAERQRRIERAPRAGAAAVLAGEAPSASAPSATGRRPRPFAVPEAADGFWNLDHTPPAAAEANAASAPRRRFAWPFRPAPAAAASGARPQVIALVGPTGAGKTTTIAKLANHPQAFAGRRAGLLCMDTYRIGGVEQARQYAELSRMPFEVVWDVKEIARALRRMRECDVVLVDTPGRGPRAEADLRETHQRLLALAPAEVHLVLPAGQQPALARRVLAAHLPLGVTHLLPTKLDEYPDERGLFELAREYGLPMRWLADGQEVPRDLQRAPAVPGAPVLEAV